MDAITVVRRPLASGLPRVAWLLVVAAFLCGGALGAALFVATWRHEATRTDAAQTAIADLRTRLSAASDGERRLRLTIRRLETNAAARIRAAARVTAAADTASTRIAAVRRQSADVGAGGSALARATATLANDLAGLNAYLAQTDASHLDPAYVQAQVAYLKAATAKVERYGGAVAGSATSLAGAVDALDANAAALAAAAARLSPSGG